jgi:hypothetical protein
MDHFHSLAGASFLKMWPLMFLAVCFPFEKKPYAWDAQRRAEVPIPKVLKNCFRVINLAIFTPLTSQGRQLLLPVPTYSELLVVSLYSIYHNVVERSTKNFPWDWQMHIFLYPRPMENTLIDRRRMGKGCRGRYYPEGIKRNQMEQISGCKDTRDHS